jgi:hypothetical protein
MNKFDIIIYKLFIWWLEPKLISNPKLARCFQQFINHWCQKHLD